MSTLDTPVIDAHAHIFERSLRMSDDKRYTPDRDALLADYLFELDQNGFTHGVLVQPSFLGFDNKYLLDALQACPDRLRGVVVVDPSLAESELARLAGSGVVGVRLNLVGRDVPNFREAPWPAFQAKLQRLSLHVEVTCTASELKDVLPSFLDSGNRVVIDHFGRPDGALGIDDPGFRYLLTAGATGQVWVKLSAVYRMDKSTFAGPDVVKSLIDALGLGRLVWGSDWPHTHFTNRMDFKSSRQQLDTLVPSPHSRRQVLGASAQMLFQILQPKVS